MNRLSLRLPIINRDPTRTCLEVRVYSRRLISQDALVSIQAFLLEVRRRTLQQMPDEGGAVELADSL